VCVCMCVYMCAHVLAIPVASQYLLQLRRDSCLPLLNDGSNGLHTSVMSVSMIQADRIRNWQAVVAARKVRGQLRRTQNPIIAVPRDLQRVWAVYRDTACLMRTCHQVA